MINEEKLLNQGLLVQRDEKSIYALSAKQARLLWIGTGLFFLGHLLIGIGIMKGQDLASAFSRPAGAIVWTFNSELATGITFSIAAFGGTLVALGIVLLAIVAANWLNYEFKQNDNK